MNVSNQTSLHIVSRVIPLTPRIHHSTPRVFRFTANAMRGQVYYAASFISKVIYLLIYGVLSKVLFLACRNESSGFG